MAKGITETDVWQAADALLLEGGRPTIERVRQKIGRGSPNTVTPYLDTWFKHLGGRIKDPGAFSAPGALPDPIHQAAQHFWEVALAEARKETDDKLTAGLAAAELSMAQAAQRVEAAESITTRLRVELLQATNDLASANDLGSKEVLAHAASRAHLETARAQNADLSERLRLIEVQLQAVRDEAHSQVAAADARAAGAEKRAALDMDRERVARVKAEKHLVAMEAKLETTSSAFSAERVKHAAESATLQANVQQLQRECLALSDKLDQANACSALRANELAAANAKVDAARAQADDAKKLFAQLKPNAKQRGQSPTKSKRVE